MELQNWKYDHYIDQLQRTTRKVHENFVVSSLFHDERLSDLLPLTQFYVRRDDSRYALIDLYYPQLHFAIEIDEPHHKNYVTQDAQRQRDVENRSGCRFVRINVESADVIQQIKGLKIQLITAKKLAEEVGAFVEWREPRFASFEGLQAELRSTLFVKIRGKIPE